MNKNEFLNELRKELKNLNVKANEIEDIISDFKEHFAFKLEEGKTEKEITKKLNSPKEIAKDYGENLEKNDKVKKGFVLAGIISLDITMIIALIVLSSFIIALSAVSFATLVASVGGFLKINIVLEILTMPYISQVFFSISLIGLSVLSAIGTIYLVLYVKQWIKVYLCFRKNVLNNNNYLSVSKHPKLNKGILNSLKLIAIISLICFVGTFVVGYLITAFDANSFEFWHVYNWFDGGTINY